MSEPWHPNAQYESIGVGRVLVPSFLLPFIPTHFTRTLLSLSTFIVLEGVPSLYIVARVLTDYPCLALRTFRFLFRLIAFRLVWVSSD